MNCQASYGYMPPPRKRRGIKRLVFGILGIIANAIGVFVMPVVAGFIALMISGVGSLALTPLGAEGGSFTATFWASYSIAVPLEDVDSASCEINGENIDVEEGDTSYSPGDVDGVEYYEVYTVAAGSSQEVTVQCEGAEDVALSEMGMASTFISFGFGIVLPLAFGFVAVVLTVWGSIALIRSS